MIPRSLRALCTGLLVAALIPSAASSQASAPTGQGMPGSVPGTEQWIVMLRNRGYSLQQALQNILALPNATARQAAITALLQLAATDQAAVAQAVVAAGGVVRKHHWVVSGMVVEVPPAALGALAAAPRVARLVPVRGRSVSDANSDVAPGTAPPPIGTSTDALNHNVAAAWAIMGDYRGAGARVAVFDTGIDADVNGLVAGTQPHPAFVDSLGATRIAAHIRAQDITDPSTRHADVNACQVSAPAPFVGASGPFGWRAGRHHQNAAHGTTTPGLLTITLDGEVPILGLVAANSPSATLRVPLLETFGEPFSGNGSAVREVAWRLTQFPPGSVWVLNGGGWTASPSPIGPCSQWLVNPVPIASGSASSGIEFGRFPVPLGTIHSEFGLQAVFIVPPPDVLATPFSNAVRVMVGGGL